MLGTQAEIKRETRSSAQTGHGAHLAAVTIRSALFFDGRTISDVFDSNLALLLYVSEKLLCSKWDYDDIHSSTKTRFDNTGK